MTTPPPLKRIITITLTGNTTEDLDDALDEAFKKLKDGYTLGHGNYDNSRYLFETNLNFSPTIKE